MKLKTKCNLYTLFWWFYHRLHVRLSHSLPGSLFCFYNICCFLTRTVYSPEITCTAGVLINMNQDWVSIRVELISFLLNHRGLNDICLHGTGLSKNSFRLSSFQFLFWIEQSFRNPESCKCWSRFQSGNEAQNEMYVYFVQNWTCMQNGNLIVELNCTCGTIFETIRGSVHYN